MASVNALRIAVIAAAFVALAGCGHGGNGGSSPVVLGSYECYTLGGSGLESAMSENFTLQSGGSFVDASGASGGFDFADGIVTFHGTALDGQRAKYVAGIPNSDNPPHLSFLRENGDEGDSCDGKG
jgi:hypothetical protein